MKKNYLVGLMVLFVIVALGAMIYLWSHSEVHVLSADMHQFTQMQQGATADVTLLKAVMRFVGKFLPTL